MPVSEAKQSEVERHCGQESYKKVAEVIGRMPVMRKALLSESHCGYSCEMGECP